MSNMYMEIVTPQRVLWRGEVTSVSAPGFLGEFEVLPEHAPFMTSLKIGVLRFHVAGGETTWAAVHGGYFEILDNRITVLADKAELASDIDVERAQKAKGKAEGLLKQFEHHSIEDIEVMNARAKLERALARQIVVSSNK